MKYFRLLILLPQIAVAATQFYNGFNYGAFWGDPGHVKKKVDFSDGFNLAKKLDTDVAFNSARLFTCIQANTTNSPTEAFDAAIESQTNLFLGFWITPATRNISNEKLVENELAALEAGFRKYGEKLSNLVIGLSVGNEDVYRWNSTRESGVSADGVAKTIQDVKNHIKSSSMAKYMADKPIGHVDTAQYAIVANADFIGMTIYPYWNDQSIQNAKASFHGSLDDVQRGAGNRPIWIAEMGWPFRGPKRGAAIAVAENMQAFWTEVGCSVFGKYNTFWYELLDDAIDGQPDWGLLDNSTRLPRVENLRCTAGIANGSNSATPNLSVSLSSYSTLSVPVVATTPTSTMLADPHSIKQSAGAVISATLTLLPSVPKMNLSKPIFEDVSSAAQSIDATPVETVPADSVPGLEYARPSPNDHTPTLESPSSAVDSPSSPFNPSAPAPIRTLSTHDYYTMRSSRYTPTESRSTPSDTTLFNLSSSFPTRSGAMTTVHVTHTEIVTMRVTMPTILPLEGRE